MAVLGMFKASLVVTSRSKVVQRRGTLYCTVLCTNTQGQEGLFHCMDSPKNFLPAYAYRGRIRQAEDESTWRER